MKKFFLTLMILIPSFSWGDNKEIFDKAFKEMRENRNYLKAEELYNKIIFPNVEVCDEYCVDAYFYLGGMYFEELHNFPTDFVKAYQYFDAASLMKHKMANVYISGLFVTGALDEHLGFGGSLFNPSKAAKIWAMGYQIFAVKLGLTQYAESISVMQKNLNLDVNDMANAREIANDLYGCIVLDEGDCSLD